MSKLAERELFQRTRVKQILKERKVIEDHSGGALKLLFRYCNFGVTYQTFYKLIKRMEQDNELKLTGSATKTYKIVATTPLQFKIEEPVKEEPVDELSKLLDENRRLRKSNKQLTELNNGLKYENEGLRHRNRLLQSNLDRLSRPQHRPQLMREHELNQLDQMIRETPVVSHH